MRSLRVLPAAGCHVRSQPKTVFIRESIVEYWRNYRSFDKSLFGYLQNMAP